MSKLTVTHDLQFRGTLHTFLARSLPLTHRSGCNLRGYFNTLNTTSIESQTEAKKLNENREYTPVSRVQSMLTSTHPTVEEEEEKKEGEILIDEGKEVDDEYRVYKAFWSIQKYLNNPC